MKYTFTLLLGLLIINYCHAQFTLQATIRPRSELRNGYKTLRNENQNPAFAISQRTRLSGVYQKEKIKLGISLQDIRTWGSQPQGVATDGAGTMLNEAWAEIALREKWHLRLGRQALSYDDERILGALDWLQQGRWHDALLVRFEDSLTTVHIGGAYNQSKETLTDTYYDLLNSYKHLHFIWAARQINRVKVSALLLNNGMQQQDSTTRFLQTLGLNALYTSTALRLQSSLYYQLGQDTNEKQVRAYLASLFLQYRPTKKWSLSLGSDLLSGTSVENQQQPASANHTFNPLYGTHHKFYGLMDYFYVGHSHREVGLWDKYITLQHQPSGKFTYSLTFHQFSSPVKVHNPDTDQRLPDNLGVEADYTFGYIFSPDVRLQGGYSQLFATSTLALLKGGHVDATQNWAWLMLTVSTSLIKINL